MSPQTVLLRTTLTRTINLHRVAMSPGFKPFTETNIFFRSFPVFRSRNESCIWRISPVVSVCTVSHQRLQSMEFVVLLFDCRTFSFIIEHSTKLLNSDWSRPVLLIPNSTSYEYLLSFHDNGAWTHSQTLQIWTFWRAKLDERHTSWHSLKWFVGLIYQNIR